MNPRIYALAALFCVSSAWAGDRTAILGTLNQLNGNWPQAALKTRLQGAELGEVVVGQGVTFQYEAALPGHVAIVLVDSHGNISLTRDPRATAAGNKGMEKFTTTEPLGTQTAYLLFSEYPLEDVFAGKSDVELGDSTPAAMKLSEQVTAAKAGNKLAVSKLQYLLVAKAGDTENTTKGILRTVAEADDDYAASAPAQSTGGSARPADLPTASSAVPASPPRIPARIEFAFNSSELTAQGKRDLDTFGEALLSNELEGRPIFLEGHTDNVGDNAYNCALSLRRAQTAERYLVDSFGVKDARVNIAAYGEGRPASPNDTEANRHQNRRVDFVFGRQDIAYAPPPSECR